jgi:hypothetical protein
MGNLQGDGSANASRKKSLRHLIVAIEHRRDDDVLAGGERFQA